MTTSEALTYAIERLCHEASVKPQEQHPEALARKLAAIDSLSSLRDSLSRGSKP